jgi:hypothetical protein
MPTKRERRNRSLAPGRTTAEAVQAWRIGDYHGLYDALGLPWEDLSPFDASEDDEPEDPPQSLIASTECPVQSWHRAIALRRRLIEIAGNPGRVGRHGEPLGPAV